MLTWYLKYIILVCELSNMISGQSYHASAGSYPEKMICVLQQNNFMVKLESANHYFLIALLTLFESLAVEERALSSWLSL